MPHSLGGYLGMLSVHRRCSVQAGQPPPHAPPHQFVSSRPGSGLGDRVSWFVAEHHADAQMREIVGDPPRCGALYHRVRSHHMETETDAAAQGKASASESRSERLEGKIMQLA